MSLSNRKGLRGVSEVAEILRSAFPEVRHRVAGEERQDKSQGRDLVGTPGYCVQSNLAADPRIWPKLREAIAASGRNEVPIAFTRRSSKRIQGDPWLVTMLAEDFIKLLVNARPPEMTERDIAELEPLAPEECVCGQRKDEHENGAGDCQSFTCGCTEYRASEPHRKCSSCGAIVSISLISTSGRCPPCASKASGHGL